LLVIEKGYRFIPYTNFDFHIISVLRLCLYKGVRLKNDVRISDNTNAVCNLRSSFWK
jgi:hypothetical protein